MIDLLITNGTVVMPGGAAQLEIGIEGGEIAFVAETGTVSAGAAQTLDAHGLIVMPGGVEAHAHIHEPMHKGWTRGEEVWLQGPEGATRAAIFGGTTTVVSMAFMDVHTTKREFNCNLAIADRTRIFSGHAYADFAFHPVLTGTPSEQTLASIKEAIQDGTVSFKVFTTDVTTAQSGIKIDDGPMLDVMRTVAENGGIVMAHAEDDELVKYMEAKLAREQRDQWYNLHLVHSSVSEEIAFFKTMRLAREAGAALYFAHVTAKQGVEAIAAARARGQPVYGEVLHNYMCFTAEDYKKPDGGKYQTYPALKTEADRRALLQGLEDRTLSVVATDEYTTPYKIKTQGKTVTTACGGHAGIETRGMILYTQGAVKGTLTLERFVELFSSAPAKILGLYPRKGAIQAGSDADLVFWDPFVTKTLQPSDLHHDSDYSIWEGWEVLGFPVTTILRGKVVVDHGKLLGAPTDGQFVKRRMQAETITRPVI